MKQNYLVKIPLLLLIFSVVFNYAISQTDGKDKKKKKDEGVRPVTIPISIFSKEELKEKQTEETLEAGDIFVKENKDEQVILSIRSVKDNPLYLAILIQSDLVVDVNPELKKLSEFIQHLPKGSRVMIGYIKNGGLQTKQKFTEDLEKASKTLQIVTTSVGFSGNSPYETVEEITKKFDALPTGRRAILLISDGLDATRGFNESTPAESLDLDKAILKAQKRSIAIYSIYAPASLTENAETRVKMNGQASLIKLSDETGGKSFIQIVSAPINFDRYLREISMALNRQFALTYLSTHMKKGYYKLQVYSTNPDIKIEHPKGYYYRKR